MKMLQQNSYLLRIKNVEVRRCFQKSGDDDASAVALWRSTETEVRGKKIEKGDKQLMCLADDRKRVKWCLSAAITVRNGFKIFLCLSLPSSAREAAQNAPDTHARTFWARIRHHSSGSAILIPGISAYCFCLLGTFRLSMEYFKAVLDLPRWYLGNCHCLAKMRIVFVGRPKC